MSRPPRADKQYTTSETTAYETLLEQSREWGPAHFAVLTGLSLSTVRNYFSEPLAPKSSDAIGRMKWLYSRVKIADDPERADEAAEKAAIQRINKEKGEIELARMKKDYVPASDVKTFLAALASAAGDQFDALEARVRREFPELSRRVAEDLERTFVDFRNGLAAWRPDPEPVKASRAGRPKKDAA